LPGKDGKPSGLKKVSFTPAKPTVLTLNPEVNEAFYAYHDGLLEIIVKGDNHDLDGNYARMAKKALRVALLLASVSGSYEIKITVQMVEDVVN
jgi:hypothetical protein